MTISIPNPNYDQYAPKIENRTKTLAIITIELLTTENWKPSDPGLIGRALENCRLNLEAPFHYPGTTKTVLAKITSIEQERK